MENDYLLKKNYLKPYYRKLFDDNKSKIKLLEKNYNDMSFKKFNKKNPEFIFLHVGTFGLTALLMALMIKLDKDEFKEQLEIWKSINKYEDN